MGPKRAHVTICLFVMATLSWGGLAPDVARAASIPAGLPTHLGLGLSAAPDSTGLYGWVPDSGIRFDYLYQYLAGGVNTGQGWQTWNDAATFPLLYAQRATQLHAIPVFTHYMLLQSTGSCDACDENQRDFTNLNSSTLMRTYYDDFVTLMKRLGSGTYDGIAGFGAKAIVHVEPDLGGYAEQAVLDNTLCFGFCTGQNNSPAELRASVASSGNAAVAGYADTYQGFNLALLHLRDMYAPNVVMAFHTSDWAGLYDIGSNTEPVDATALGRTVASFANASGVARAPGAASSYELVFNDVVDRDAGQYKYQFGYDNYWDRLNVRVPTFHRWEQFIGAITAATDRPMFVWQIPLGNQYFQSENNTNGHYQDNRAEYFFTHLAELRSAGIGGLLFGLGNGGSTQYFDGKADGVTNPPVVCTTDGLSSGQVCNNHVATVSDDDGGYLRAHARAYLAAPLPLVPAIGYPHAVPPAFSPNGDGITDTTLLTYTLAAPATVTLDVFNGSGARVRTLAGGARAAGAHVELWNGRTDGGTRVPDGPYRLEIAARSFFGATNGHGVAVVDTVPPAPSVITAPTRSVTTSARTYLTAGSSEAGSLVRIWRDANHNGRVDPGERLAARITLSTATRTWALTVSLAIGTNAFLATATDRAGNASTRALALIRRT